MMAPPTAAMPQKGNIDPALAKPRSVKTFPNIDPVAVPINNAGEKTPPNKPELKHIDVIKIFKIKIVKTKLNEKFPFSMSTILWVPKPNI